MKLEELVLKDPLYLAELRFIYWGSFLFFMSVFYALTTLSVFTPYGRIFSEYVSSLLPDFLLKQSEVLKEFDTASHMAYPISLILVLVCFPFYSIKSLITTKAFYRRLIVSEAFIPGSLKTPLVVALFLVVFLAELLFQGTMGKPSGFSRRKAFLLWPLSGFIAYGAMILPVIFIQNLQHLYSSRKFTAD